MSPSAPSPAPLLLSVTETAALLGISRAKTYEMVAAGLLPRLKIGKTVRIPRQRLEEWISAQTEQPREAGHA